MADPRVQAFWERFLRSAPRREPAILFEAFSIGNRPEHADHGAAVILSGRKTATSSPMSDWAEPGMVAPFVGALSIVLDGRGEPVCVVETVEAETRRLGEVDEGFARDYGEWDGTLPTWRREMIAFHEGRADLATVLLCERFRVVWTG
ncbi:ASCH domain-containing protein [Muricoccus radiodurans]|uniref:ASCH domain-containing protein n=1 Tax=Muricoccus radiodurans TaxID=2231721 RepID=UPI003CEB2970